MNPQFTIRRVLTAASVVLLLTSHVGAGETVVDAAHGFTLTLPDGFEAHPDLVGAMPEAIHGFVLGDPTDDQLDVILWIEEMGGVIGRSRFKPEDLPAGVSRTPLHHPMAGF